MDEKDKTKVFKQEFKTRCIHFSLEIIKLCQRLRSDRNCWPLIDQLMRSATSIGANVIEGGFGSSKKDFVNFFQIAAKSAVETIYWLSLVKEINIQEKRAVEDLIDECNQLRRIISTIILNTKNERE